MDTITLTVAENDPDVVVSATLNEEAVTITLVEAQDGTNGTNGAGVAAGGSANDILKKTNSTDYATGWETPTSAATASTIVRRDAAGGVVFGEITAGSLFTTASDGVIFTTGSTAGIFTSGATAPIYTQGATAEIYTQGATAKIYTQGANAHIETQNSSASVKSYNFAAISATDGASLRNSAGTAILTWGATAGNISISVDIASTGHFFSNPGSATAGHFVTKNGTAPTIVAGRSAWFSDATGVPQFRNGTGSALTLVYNGGALGTPSSGTLSSCTGLPVSTGISGMGTGVSTLLQGIPTGSGGIVGPNTPTLITPLLGTPTSGTLTNCTGLPVSSGISGLGTNVAAFLATPTSANLAAALTDETGTGAAVFGTNPTLTGYTEATVAIGNSGTSKTLSLATGTFQTVTLTGNCTFTMPTATAGQSFIVKILTGAGSFTGTFTSVKWPGGTAPTITATASKYDLASFIADGTAWSGSIIQNFTA